MGKENGFGSEEWKTSLSDVQERTRKIGTKGGRVAVEGAADETLIELPVFLNDREFSALSLKDTAQRILEKSDSPNQE